MTVKSIWHGMDVEGFIIFGTEGDATIPRGTRRLSEITDIHVWAPDGEDIADSLKAIALFEIESILLKESV